MYKYIRTPRQRGMLYVEAACTMAKFAVAPGWSGGRRRMQSQTTAVKKAHICCGDPAVIRFFLKSSVPTVQNLYSTDARITKGVPSRICTGGVPALASHLRCSCARAVDPYFAVACTTQSTVSSYKLGATVGCPFVATRFCSTTAATEQSSWCQPTTGESTDHFPRWSTVEKQPYAGSCEESQDYRRPSCGGVCKFSRSSVAPFWRRACDGRHDYLKKQQQPPAVSCSSAWDAGKHRDTEGVPTLLAGVPPDTLHIPPTTAKPACGAAQRMHCVGSSRRRTFRRGRSKDMLNQLRNLSQFPQWQRWSSGDVVLRAVYLVSAGVRKVTSERQQSRHFAMTPPVCSVPADVHPADRSYQQRRQFSHTLTQQPPCLREVGVMRQILEPAAALSASRPFLQASAVTPEDQRLTVAACQSSAGVCRDRTCGKEGIGGESDKQRHAKNALGLLCHEGQQLLQCEYVKELQRVRREKNLDCPSVLRSTSECFRRLQYSMRPLPRGAGETGSAAEMRKSLALESDIERRPGGRVPLALDAIATTSCKKPPRGAFEAETASTAAPTTIWAHAETAPVCTRATNDTEATAEGTTAAGTGRSAGAAGAATGLAGFAGTAAIRLRDIVERRELLARSSADAHGWKMLQGGAFVVLDNRIVGGIPAGFAWRPAAALTGQNVGHWKVATQRQQQIACDFASLRQFPCGWMASASYSSCSAATLERLGKGTRSSRAPVQLSRKELKGLQGHPRRYQLMGGRPEFHHIDRNKNGHIIEPTDKFQVVMTTSKNNVHVQVLNKSRAYRTIFGSFAGNVGYRKRAQQEPQCAYRIGQNIARKCRRLGICQVDVKFRRIMRVEQLLQAFAAHGLGVTSITHEPRLPKCGQNSTKPRKRRRV